MCAWPFHENISHICAAHPWTGHVHHLAQYLHPMKVVPWPGEGLAMWRADSLSSCGPGLCPEWQADGQKQSSWVMTQGPRHFLKSWNSARLQWHSQKACPLGGRGDRMCRSMELGSSQGSGVTQWMGAQGKGQRTPGRSQPRPKEQLSGEEPQGPSPWGCSPVCPMSPAPMGSREQAVLRSHRALRHDDHAVLITRSPYWVLKCTASRAPHLRGSPGGSTHLCSRMLRA